MRPERHPAVVVGLLAALLAFLAVIQVRSQAEVARSLEAQDNTSLAFLIDNLHVANDQLLAQADQLNARREALARGGGSNVSTLTEEMQHLRVLEGLVAARGPGVVITVDAPLNALDIEDALNNLRAGGAEAISINGKRVITRTAITQKEGQVLIDAAPMTSPWTVDAIGDPDTLQPNAEAMTSSLRADPRVKSVGYEARSSLVIQAVLRPRPFVYASS